MKLTELPVEFIKAGPILERIQQAGYEAYFVGGSVRDVLLNKPIHDVDIASSAFPAEVKSLFPKTIDVGIQHGTVMVLVDDETYEITTFRTESAYQDFRRPDHVEFVRSLAEDLKRRDFTINAFAVAPDGEIIDLFNGLQDLEHKILRAVGNPYERFHEDALRMMRGLRFVSHLGFSLEAETFQAIKDYHHLLAKISVERINVEFVKLLLGDFRKAGLISFVESGCYLYCPGLKEQATGLLQLAELVGPTFTSELEAWTLLAEEIQLPLSQVRPFLKSWKCANKLISETQTALTYLRIRKSRDWQIEDIYQIGSKMAQFVENLLPFYQIPTNDARISVLDSQLVIHQLNELAVNGNDLMIFRNERGGSWLKESLAFLEKAVILRKVSNEKDALLNCIAQKWKEASK
jgi:tRNA nucleotidyltransferase (CCA-adding enzyme)